MPRRHLLLIAVCLTGVGVRLWIGPHVLDDAYITFRYSERLAAGLGFTYNDGAHVLGTTSPLMTVILAAAAFVRLPIDRVAFALSCAADAATIALGASLLRREGFKTAPVLYGLAVALSPLTIYYAVSGLETSLYLTLLLLSLWLLQRDRPIALALTLAALPLCRIDGALMSILCGAAIMFRRSSRLTYAIAALALAPWLVFAVAYFGSLIPASVQAKAHLRVTAGTSMAIFAQFFWAGIYIALSPLAVAGALVLARRPNIAWRVGLLWWAGYAATFIIAGAFSAYPWYFVPLLPLYFAAASAAAEMALIRVVTARLRPAVSIAVVGIAAVFLAWRVLTLPSTIESWQLTREHLYRDVAERVLDRHACVLAATEIGTLGYYYRGPVLDLVGLVTPEAAGQPISRTLESSRPCWIVSYSDLLGGATLPPGYRLRFSRPINPARTLLVYEWPP
jgi:hypothetical protein